LIHCVEGGFVLGATDQEVRDNVAELAKRGVGYVTLAHLFWRRVATNAPALPFLPDWLYRVLFRQPRNEGLSELGRTAVAAMLENKVLVDVTHMSARSLQETLDHFDELDPDRTFPVIASHGAYRFGHLAYNLDADTIRRIAARGGVIGLIMCSHYIASGLRPRAPRMFEHSFHLLCEHIDQICEVTESFDNVAIGSDLDGFIKPALPGLEHMGRMARLQDELVKRYGGDLAAKITHGNALRVLEKRFK
jgi:microsomal dipeptidase-like Zn-dependent dipeptidase